MLSLDQMKHHPTSERIVEILCEKTQSKNHLFFRVLVGFHFSMMAAQMRCSIKTHDRGVIPVNMYAINLMPSGAGKGFSTNIMEEQITGPFRERFMESFDAAAEANLQKLAFERSSRKDCDESEELLRVQKEFNQLGPLVYTFDSGTPPAVKQMRHKLLMANAGAVNLVIDEIGSNLTGQIEVLNTFLELYDVGAIKQKLVKNTQDNVRGEEIRGKTPTNMMLFGTPTKLLNGSKTEEEFNSMLETGYARRSFFGLGGDQKKVAMTPDEVYDLMTSNNTVQFIDDLSEKLETLADPSNMRKVLTMDKDTALLIIEYKLKCEAEAAELGEHEETRKAEITHRYFKALKLAGAYAFVDDSPILTQDHFYAAVKLAEESGEAFKMLLSRDRTYVKLAKYLANTNREMNYTDLIEDLPFFRGSKSQREELILLATAWGYKNNVIIKKAIRDNVDFIRGESLKATDIKGSDLIVTYSRDMTEGYYNDKVTWDNMAKLVGMPRLHWIAHHLAGGYRNEENAIPGFNMVVLDIDGTCKLELAKQFLEGYKAILYTTKSHTDSDPHFRIVLPLNYHLKFDAKEYKEFYNALVDSLPFEVDPQCSHRCKKWLTHEGTVEVLDGELYDALPFIPRTSKDEERRSRLQDQSDMDRLERWVINNSGDGNRNNMLLRFAMILVENGFGYDTIKNRVLGLNAKMQDSLDETELLTTVLITVQKKLGV
ncbi:N4 gp43-like protein [Pseudomonas phage LUZ7]|uniref:N4 gp43-like protein n=1 Tax=Pseudomonas phage LUZ7 TaxID=655097 RepID=C8ZKG2_9CAUD|nr:DNA primase [Pseudomonas phage LUZ7]CAZ66204.1 N4 gp43-like protein [Pseudomonas phage LUZ7]